MPAGASRSNRHHLSEEAGGGGRVSRHHGGDRRSGHAAHPSGGGGGRRGGGRLRAPRDFTFISGWVKYSMFFFNFLFWLLGGLLMGIGAYAMIDKWQSGDGFKLQNVFDIIFNLAFLLIII